MVLGPLGDDWLEFEGAILGRALDELVRLDVHALVVAAHGGQGSLEQPIGGKVAKGIVH